jgi:carbohydrate diacid regulator
VIISRELAQKIVDHLMEIVQRNVNIMDCSGVIIASGQFHRVNTFHEGGKIAVAEHHVVEIYPEEVQSYAGALPGVMWPIDLKAKTVGVVGVTGEPQEVRNTAKLVKTVTELILEREMYLADYGSENRMKEQLVNLLFSDNQSAVMDDMNTLAIMLKYKLNVPRLVVVVKLEPTLDEKYAADGLQNLLSDRMRESVSNLIKEATYFSPDDMSLFYKKHLCILKALPDNADRQKLDIFATSVLNMLNSIRPRLKIQIGIGSRAVSASQLWHSYCEAVFALEYADSGMIHSISEFEILVNYLIRKKDVPYSSCLTLMELKQHFDEIKVKYDMHRTLAALLANNLSISETANALFIHRNTLKFRLDKLKKVVGLEPCHFFQHAMLCKYLLSASEEA